MHRLAKSPAAAKPRPITVVVFRYVINHRENRSVSMYDNRSDGMKQYSGFKKLLQENAFVKKWEKQGVCSVSDVKNAPGDALFRRTVIRDEESEGGNRFELEIKEIYLNRCY